MLHHAMDLTVALIGLFWIWRSNYWRKKYEAEKKAKEQRDNWVRMCGG